MISYLDYSSIQVNPENFRHNPVLTECDAMIYLINDTISDTIDLCNKMIKFGFREQEVLTVVKFEDQEYAYKALDGNRRLTCMKLLLGDMVLPNHPRYKKLTNFLENADISKVKRKIPCIVHEEESIEVYEYIRDKHVSSEGTEKKWDAKQQRRFNRRVFDEVTDTEQIVRAASDKLYEDLKNVTTMERMINTPEKRTKLGITQSNIGFVLTDNAKRYITQISEDINNGGLTSRTVNSKGDIFRYIERIIRESEESANDISKDLNEKGNESNSKDNHKTQTSNSADNEKNSKTKKRKYNVSNLRNNLIPRSLDITSDNIKIQQVIDELKGLSLHTYTFSVAVLFRTFIELCLVYYSNDNIYGYKYLDNTLHATLISAINVTYGKNKVDRSYHTNISKFLNGKGCINLLNGYVHDLSCYPDRALLIDTFNNLERFLSDILLKRLNKKLF